MKVPNKKDYCFIKRFCSISILTILIFNSLSGQNCKYINNTNNLSPLVLIISQDSFFDKINDSIINLQNKAKVSFLLVNASQKSTNEITDTVNLILNKEYLINKTKIYLIIIGDKIFFDQQNQFSNKLFSSKYFIHTGNQIIDSTSFKTVCYNNMNLKNIISELLKSRLWEFDVYQIQKLSIEEELPFKKSWELGLGYTTHYPGPIRTDDDFPRKIPACEIQISRNLSEKYKIWSSLTFNKLMFIKKKDNGGQTINLDANKQIVESMMFSRSLSITRFFYVTQSPDFKPFIALGFSHTSLSLMYAKTKRNDIDMEMELYSCGSLMITSGLEINLNDRLRLNGKMSYHISLNSFNTMNDFNMTFGLSYIIQRKRKPFYKYLRLK